MGEGERKRGWEKRIERKGRERRKSKSFSIYISRKGWLSISNNVIITQEIIHIIKRKRDRGGLLRVKLNMEKAYDSMEWNFFVKIIKNLGFFEQFWNLILFCLSLVTYSLLLKVLLSVILLHKKGLDNMILFLLIYLLLELKLFQNFYFRLKTLQILSILKSR